MVCLVGVKIIGIFIVIVHESQSCNCYTPSVSCHISMIFILIAFKPPKSTPTMVDLSTKRFSPHFVKRFNYSVGVTTNRSCFMQIIGHKSLTVHRICTKLDTRICLWTAFLCATFKGDRSTRLGFIAIFASVPKHEERN